MKRALLVLMALVLLTSTCWAQGAAPKGQEVTMTGMFVCAFCNLPAMGKCSKECCQNCLKAGDPPLLSDEKGTLYILLTGEHEKPLLTPERIDLLTQKITVKGMLVKRGGLQAIYVKSMEKAK
jgi:hypothetical protein